MNIIVRPYSDKAGVVSGVTRDDTTLHLLLKSLGCKWNPSIHGWIFPIYKFDSVQSVVQMYNARANFKLD